MTKVEANRSLFEKLVQSIYLDRVLKLGGVAWFGLTYLNAWHGLSPYQKFAFGASIVMWYVGLRFSRIYR